jgi:hypothetical protein
VWHHTARLGPAGPPDHPSDHRAWIIIGTLVVLVLVGVGAGELLGKVLAAGIQALLGIADG